MKFVVDANILFSFFSEKSFTRSFILNHPEIEYFTPAYVFDELEKYEETIKYRLTLYLLDQIIIKENFIRTRSSRGG